jgi:GNAT superfamily N-acetyltransferase
MAGMDEAAVLALYDRQMRRDVVADGPESVVERADGVVRQTGRPYDWNGILYSDLAAATADAVIAAQVAHFRARNTEFEWKWYAHDTPADLPDRLRAAGFVPEEDEALMVASIDELPMESPLPDGVRLEPVADAAGIDRVVAVHEAAFGTPGDRLRRRLLDQLAEAPDTTFVALAVAGDVDVCAVRMELNAGTAFASLWGGGTRAEWRGRGIYRALVAYRARIAADHGYAYLHADCSSDSRPILARLGFVRLSTTVPFIWSPRT